MLSRLKKYLKSIPAIYSVNAFLKARVIKRKSDKLISYYSDLCKKKNFIYSREEAIASALRKISERGIGGQNRRKGESNIFWVGAHYDQDMSGTLQGLSRFGNVLTYKNFEGGYGLLWPSTAKRKISLEEISKLNSAFLLEQVAKAKKENGVDILIGQMWADVLGVETLRAIQDMGIVTANIAMDDKLPQLWRKEGGKKMGAIGLAEGIDIFLTTTQDVCSWYGVLGFPAIYFPLASDPDLFYPRAEKKYDVVFVGANYGFRGEIVNKLISAGVKVDAFGPGWPNGFINAAKISEVFGQAKIILGIGGVGYNRDILTLKLRDFDATMAGALYITSRNPDLSALFKEGEEMECYSTFPELLDKAKFYLANTEKREEIAAAGLKRAKTEHTWEKRFGDVLNSLGLIQ